MADELNFIVKGSQGDHYQVNVTREGTNLFVSCNCRAGQFGKFCKHKWNVLRGEAELVSDNYSDMETVNNWMFNSDLRDPFLATTKAILTVKEAEDNLKKQRNNFAKLIKRKN